LVLSLGASLFGTALLAGCSAVDRITGKEGASDDSDVAKLERKDPLARPVQVAWVSARASYCGFIFDPVKLRADFLASEQSLGTSEADMKKITHAYDYTLNSVTETIKSDPDYCSKSRTDAIRSALNRYLGGDYAPDARLGR
jgi:hypothetical protein